jgi:hypothetical protein
MIKKSRPFRAMLKNGDSFSGCFNVLLMTIFIAFFMGCGDDGGNLDETTVDRIGSSVQKDSCDGDSWKAGYFETGKNYNCLGLNPKESDGDIISCPKGSAIVDAEGGGTVPKVKCESMNGRLEQKEKPVTIKPDLDQPHLLQCPYQHVLIGLIYKGIGGTRHEIKGAFCARKGEQPRGYKLAVHSCYIVVPKNVDGVFEYDPNSYQPSVTDLGTRQEFYRDQWYSISRCSQTSV